ncbi:hypothetical protein Echvi_0689 [Echinicola vietnamensis DSM 17526]|uniref:Uncharacterized protein n=1 Tax=Echinicola vietnamensis (strain DSM 17526 / LMG 23754 / KMM 6221) TaxID=926556 RepID=L0FW31_ECHVK|nr:hypothetical protein Echvi_0689 [Echinicola vietnamensis DSM 17526]
MEHKKAIGVDALTAKALVSIKAVLCGLMVFGWGQVAQK